MRPITKILSSQSRYAKPATGSYISQRQWLVTMRGSATARIPAAELKLIKSTIKENFTRRSELERFHFSNGEALFVARDRSRDNRSVLVIDHYVPQPDRDAGSRSMLHIMEALIEAAFNVKFW